MRGGIQSPSSGLRLQINYWEEDDTSLERRLERLKRSGVTRLTSFLPWQAFESDIRQRFLKFLQMVTRKEMDLELIVTPEPGLHYPRSGLPRDLVEDKKNWAQSSEEDPYFLFNAPEAFPLPSIGSPQFLKRYYNFLSRLHLYLSDFHRSSRNLLDHLTLVLGGSYWKYYRAPRYSVDDAFAGRTGDFSRPMIEDFRKTVEDFYAHPEFLKPNPSAANRWKERKMESTNWSWYFQQKEDVFRLRTAQILCKNSLHLKIRHAEIFNPEADPGFHYSNLLQRATGNPPDFSKLSRSIEDAGQRVGAVGEYACAPVVHWSGMGGFRSLSDSEKQLLLLKSLLLVGGRGGSVLVPDEIWFELSLAFQGRFQALSEFIDHQKLRLRAQAVYVSPQLWGQNHILWEQLHEHFGPRILKVASVDQAAQEPDALCCIVDPRVILTKDFLLRALKFCEKGGVLALPKSATVTEDAREEWDELVEDVTSLKMESGLPYEVFPRGRGKVLAYDVRDAEEGSGEPWKQFALSLASLAEVRDPCRFDDDRISVVELHKSMGEGRGRGLFVFNESARSVSADIIFPDPTQVHELGRLVGGMEESQDSGEPSERYQLEVPPFGVLPLGIEGGQDLGWERKQADDVDLDGFLEDSDVSEMLSEPTA